MAWTAPATVVAGQLMTAAFWNTHVRDNELFLFTSILPTGVILGHGAAAAPTGFLLCDGAAVSRATYSALFTAISTTWGVGDGSTTFNLPDGRGRALYGKAVSGTGATLGGTFGDMDHRHTGPSHTHTISSDGDHQHTLTINNNTNFQAVGGGSGVTVAKDFHNHTGNTNVTGSHTHSGNTGAGGTGLTGPVNPPAFVGNYIIKT